MAELSSVANSPEAAVDSTTTQPTATTTNEDKEPTTYEVNLPPTDVLRRLGLQLEYYFSEANLSKDTYLRTLRDINDGYVLASILANFAKVQSLCPVDSYHAVVEAAKAHSDNLEVVHLHKETSKRVQEQDENTLLAIGPVGSKPISLSIPSPATPETSKSISAAASSSLSSPQPPVSSPAPSAVQNTVILREVAPGVTEQEIRSLFEDAPPIQTVHEDVGYCWFVTFDTTSRDEMLRAMMSLRTKELRGEPVKARLKAGVAAPAAPTLPPMMGYPVYAGDRNLPYARNHSHHHHHHSGGNPNNHRPKKGGGNNMNLQNGNRAPRSPNNGKKAVRRNRSNSNGNTNHQPNGINSSGHHSNGSNDMNNTNGKKNRDSYKKPSQPAPELVESHFPALVMDANTAVKEDDDKSPTSDGASTATTNSTSSSATKQPQMSGYAAALLKAPTPEEVQKAQQLQKEKEAAKKAEEAKKSENGSKKADNNSPKKNNNGSKDKNKKKSDEKRKKEKTEGEQQGGTEAAGTATAAVNPEPEATVEAEVVPLTWGGGKSFADILKKEETAASASS